MSAPRPPRMIPSKQYRPFFLSFFRPFFRFFVFLYFSLSFLDARDFWDFFLFLLGKRKNFSPSFICFLSSFSVFRRFTFWVEFWRDETRSPRNVFSRQKSFPRSYMILILSLHNSIKSLFDLGDSSSLFVGGKQRFSDLRSWALAFSQFLVIKNRS